MQVAKTAQKEKLNKINPVTQNAETADRLAGWPSEGNAPRKIQREKFLIERTYAIIYPKIIEQLCMAMHCNIILAQSN